MPLGVAFHSLNLANPAAGGGGGDAPTIPTLSWSRGAWHTATFNNSTRYTTSALNGLRADGWHYLFGRGDSSAGRFVHNDNRNLSLGLNLGAAPTAARSTSLYSNTANRGGNTFSIFSTSTRLRVCVGAVANWTTTPTQTSNPIGTVGTTLFTRTGGLTTDTAITTVADPVDTTTRVLTMWSNNSAINMAYFAAQAGASSFSLNTGALTVTGSLSVGAHMGLAGFSNALSSSSQVNNWIIGAFEPGGTNYRVQGGTSNFWLFNAGTANWNTTLLQATTSAAGGGVAVAWDDFANNKRVAVGMIQDGTTVKARAINSSGTAGTANNSVVTGVFQAKISRVNSVSSGFGMVLITYLKTSATTEIYGRLVSVDSSTLALTVGAEMFIGVTGGGYNIGTTPSYGIDCVRDGTNWAFTAVWANGANNNGGGSFSTATG